MASFRKILVANRGEIALRVIRACAELGIPSVAVYSDADRESAHVRAAGEAFRIGPPPARQSYLDVDKLLEVARTSGCDAVHPGYGFLAENAAFARRCADAGLTFIGPSPDAIEGMGDKVAARRTAQAARMPIVPGTVDPVPSAQAARALADSIGYPVALKASAGGGGKGLKVAARADEVESAFALAAKEAVTYFNDPTIYVERYLVRPKHVEVQVLGDKHGHVVHMGERDCSLQRRHQKLVEETPAAIPAATRTALLDAAVGLARAIGYDSAGTIECLVDGERFYFLEMNTRIQVEHTVTEMVWGVDLVKAQIRIAAGEPLWFAQADLSPRGHAIECRVNAESVLERFRPSAGRLDAFAAPAGPGVRVDSAAYAGWTVPQEYDSLLAKVVAWGADREEARRRMLRALAEFDVRGVETTIGLFALLLDDEVFTSADYATSDIDAFVESRREALVAADKRLARGAAAAPAATAGAQPRTVTVEVNDKRFDVTVYVPDDRPRTGNTRTQQPKFRAPKKIASDERSVVAPMHGILADVKVAPGDAVRDGQVIAIIEAMKMMNEVIAHRSGVVASVDARVGETLEAFAPIVTLAAT